MVVYCCRLRQYLNLCKDSVAVSYGTTQYNQAQHSFISNIVQAFQGGAGAVTGHCGSCPSPRLLDL